MPHYKDSTPARPGDHVIGPVLDLPGHIIAGTLISINAKGLICNGIVQYTELIAKFSALPTTAALVVDVQGHTVAQERTVRTARHDTAGAEMRAVVCTGFCTLSDMTKVS